MVQNTENTPLTGAWSVANFNNAQNDFFPIPTQWNEEKVPERWMSIASPEDLQPAQKQSIQEPLPMSQADPGDIQQVPTLQDTQLPEFQMWWPQQVWISNVLDTTQIGDSESVTWVGDVSWVSTTWIPQIPTSMQWEQKTVQEELEEKAKQEEQDTSWIIDPLKELAPEKNTTSVTWDIETVAQSNDITVEDVKEYSERWWLWRLFTQRSVTPEDEQLRVEGASVKKWYDVRDEITDIVLDQFDFNVGLWWNIPTIEEWNKKRYESMAVNKNKLVEDTNEYVNNIQELDKERSERIDSAQTLEEQQRAFHTYSNLYVQEYKDLLEKHNDEKISPVFGFRKQAPELKDVSYNDVVNFNEKVVNKLIKQSDVVERKQAISRLVSSKLDEDIHNDLQNSDQLTNNKFTETLIILSDNMRRKFWEENVAGNIDAIKEAKALASAYNVNLESTFLPLNDFYINYLRNQDDIKEWQRDVIENSVRTLYDDFSGIDKRMKELLSIHQMAMLDWKDPNKAIVEYVGWDIDSFILWEETTQSWKNAWEGRIRTLNNQLNTSIDDKSLLYKVYNWAEFGWGLISQWFSWTAVNATDQWLNFANRLWADTSSQEVALSDLWWFSSVLSEDAWQFHRIAAKVNAALFDQWPEVLWFVWEIFAWSAALKALQLPSTASKVTKAMTAYKQLKNVQKVKNIASSYSNVANVAKNVVGATLTLAKEVAIWEALWWAILQKMWRMSTEEDININMMFWLIDLAQVGIPFLRLMNIYRNIWVNEVNNILRNLWETTVKPNKDLVKQINNVINSAKRTTARIASESPEVANRTWKFALWRDYMDKNFREVWAREKVNAIDAIKSYINWDFTNLPESVKPIVKWMIEDIWDDTVKASEFAQTMYMPKIKDADGNIKRWTSPTVHWPDDVSKGDKTQQLYPHNRWLAWTEETKSVWIKTKKKYYTQQEVDNIKKNIDNLDEVENDWLRSWDLFWDQIESWPNKGKFEINRDLAWITDNRAPSQKVVDDSISTKSWKDFYKVLRDNWYSNTAQKFEDSNLYDNLVNSLSLNIC